MTADHLKELCEINRKLLGLRAHWEGPKEIVFDKDLLYIDFCQPDHTPRHEFKEFFRTCESLLPSNYVLRGVRLDKGFFSENNIALIEGKHLEYAAKVPLYTNLRSWLEKRPEENLAWYDDRATCENYIKELQYGFGADELSQHEKTKNHAYAFVKAIAYNLTNFFKSRRFGISWRFSFYSSCKVSLKKTPFITLRQVKLLIAATFDLKSLSPKTALEIVNYYMRQNHRAYLSHRKRALREMSL